MRCATLEPASTSNSRTATSGRYIRRSAPTSVAIGTMELVGASVRKNQVPQNASRGASHHATDGQRQQDAAPQGRGQQTDPSTRVAGSP